DLDEFCRLFEAEAAAAGGELRGRGVLELLAGDLRPAMVEAVRRCHERLKTACLTNNVVIAGASGSPHQSLMAELFDLVIESSKIGVRKPDPEFYRLACEGLGVEPGEAVFLDD